MNPTAYKNQERRFKSFRCGVVNLFTARVVKLFTVTLANILTVGMVKVLDFSNSARILFREFPGLKKRLWSGEMWEDGYFARTVGDRMTRDVIEKYIASHREFEQGPAQLDFKLR